MTDEVAVSKKVVESLTIGCLNALEVQSDEGDGCCPFCCPACAALLKLYKDAHLDSLARTFADGDAWWNIAQDQVDRDWLRRAWRRIACHEGRIGYEGLRKTVTIRD